MSSLACGRCTFSNGWDSNFCGRCGLDLSKVAVQSIDENALLELPETDIEGRNDFDDSIIDVGNVSYAIPQSVEQLQLSKSPTGVPFWQHNYIYSFSEINYASKSQKAFYQYFKNALLKGELVDIEGNSNYAFILLYDLEHQHKTNRDNSRLEEYFLRLGKICPETIRYSRGILRDIMTSSGDSSGLKRLSEREQDEEYWKFGSKYKKKLGLQFEEVELLNKLSYPRSNFVEIEYCCFEVIKLYLSTIEKLKASFVATNTTLENEFERIADIVARKHFRYRFNSYNYQWAIQSANANLYSIIFKHCENAVRELYEHKRKLNPNSFDSPHAKEEIAEAIESKVTEIIRARVHTIEPPDEDTEIELNAQNTNRWKSKLLELTEVQAVNGKRFVDDLLELGRLNKRNASIENIFYEGSKFIANIDEEAALTLYIYHLHYDLLSSKFDNKKFTKTIQKALFKTNEQLHEFERIVSEFISDRNLDKALLAVTQIYAIKRKKIKLDSESIREVHSKHSGTVGLLNEYLQDEFEDSHNSIVSKEISSDEVQIEITRKGFFPVQEIASNVELNALQTELLILLEKSNFCIEQDEVEAFARRSGLFRNQLVESINDACYEILDDVLIEEEDKNYLVDRDYYRKIMNL